MSTGPGPDKRHHIPTSTSSTQPIVQDQSAYVYHEIKPHMEPYLPTIMEEEPLKMAPVKAPQKQKKKKHHK
jgi:hypothetical protein